VVSLAIPVAIGAGSLAFRKLAPRGLSFLRSRGFRGFRARPIIRAAAGSIGVAALAGAVTEGIVRGAPAVIRIREREQPMQQALARRSTQTPVRRGQIVTAGPVPVTFVKRWTACEAQFAIDDQGVRWVWRPRLGIWKRIRNTRNIVISGKDLRRAKRLVRISKRLNKMRQQLR